MYPNIKVRDFHKMLKYWKDAKIGLSIEQNKFIDVDTGEIIEASWNEQMDNDIPIGIKVALVQQPDTLDWIVFGFVQEPSDPV